MLAILVLVSLVVLTVGRRWVVCAIGSDRMTDKTEKGEARRQGKAR